jgi:hypothetical protein
LNEVIRVSVVIEAKDINTDTNNSQPIIKFVNLRITNKIIVFDLLKASIRMLNDIFEKENLSIRLKEINVNEGKPNVKESYNNYIIKPSKKNGRPDPDVPSKITKFIYKRLV